MREYGKVFCAIWSSDDFRALSEDGRALVMYLLTCPHCTAIGAFRLPDAYAAEDLQWSAGRVAKGFAELFQNGFATRDERSKWVVIHRFMDWNPIENPNQAKAAAKLVAQMPQCAAKYMLLQAIRRIGRYLDLLDREPFPNPSETLPEPGTGTGTGEGTGAKEMAAKLSPPSAKPPDAARGCRLPDDWQPSEADMAFAASERPDVDAASEAKHFRDYWRAKPGADGRKADWSATWRNWIRRTRGMPTARASPMTLRQQVQSAMDEFGGTDNAR